MRRGDFETFDLPDRSGIKPKVSKMTNENLHIEITKSWCSKPEQKNCIQWQTIDTSKVQGTSPLYVKHPFEAGVYAVLVNADLKYFSISLKKGTADIEISHHEPLNEAKREFIRQKTGCNSIDGILKYLQRANPQFPADGFQYYSWKDILNTLKQTAQTAAQSTNAAQTDPETRPSDGKPQKVIHNMPSKAERIRRNKAVAECIDKFVKYHSKITVAKISEITGLPAKKIYNIPAYRTAARNGLICKATDKNTIAGQVKPYEDVNLHTGQGQSHLRELTTDIDYDELIMLEDNADFNGYE